MKLEPPVTQALVLAMGAVFELAMNVGLAFVGMYGGGGGSCKVKLRYMLCDVCTADWLLNGDAPPSIWFEAVDVIWGFGLNNDTMMPPRPPLEVGVTTGGGFGDTADGWRSAEEGSGSTRVEATAVPARGLTVDGDEVVLAISASTEANIYCGRTQNA